MSDLFKFTGSIVTTAASSSLNPQVVAEIDEKMALGKQALIPIELSADAAVAVPFGVLTGAHVIVIKTTTRVTARITSLDGSQQLVPVDTVLVLECRGRPVTALDLIRTAGVYTTGKVFLGEAG